MDFYSAFNKSWEVIDIKTRIQNSTPLLLQFVIIANSPIVQCVYPNFVSIYEIAYISIFVDLFDNHVVIEKYNVFTCDFDRVMLKLDLT